MLSGESANGKFPAESLAMMSAIIDKTENWMPPIASLEKMMALSDSPGDAMAASAVFTAEKLQAGAIVVKGDASGDFARLVAKYRPSMPVLTLLDPSLHGAKVARQLSVHRGVFPTLLSHAEALPAAAQQKLVEDGDEVVVVYTSPAHGLSMSVFEFQNGKLV